MPPTLSHRHLWSPAPLCGSELMVLLATAEALKQTMHRSSGWQPLRGRHLALLCAAPGATAETFGRAVSDIGGSVALLPTGAWRSSNGSGLPDAARVLGRLYDAIDCCDLPQHVVEEIERHAGVPVFDGVVRPDHPLRVLAELLAMREASGRRLEQLRVRIDGDASPSQHAAAALVRSSGVQLQRREAAALAIADAADDAPADELDFVLDLSAPIAAGRLTVPGAPAVEQARIAALLADNQRVVLQAVIVNVLG